MVGRVCSAATASGRPCRATPMSDVPFCFWHAPETAEEAAEARRLGGLHRRKKKTIATIYGFTGLRTVDDCLGLVETAAIETLALENSIARNRTLGELGRTAARLVEGSDHEGRIATLEALLAARRRSDDLDDDAA